MKFSVEPNVVAPWVYLCCAEDLVILSLSAKGLQRLVDICAAFRIVAEKYLWF